MLTADYWLKTVDCKLPAFLDFGLLIWNLGFGIFYVVYRLGYLLLVLI